MLNKVKLIAYFFFLSVIQLTSSPAVPQSFKDIFVAEEGKNINVTSNSLALRNNDDLAIFYDDVVVTQGEIKLKADEVVVITESVGENRKRFKIVEAKDGVLFSGAGKQVKADEARYVIDDGLVVLKGNIIIEEKGNNIKGDKFTYNVKSGKTSIKSLNEDGTEAKKTRVQAVITPGDNVEGVDVPIPPVKILESLDGGEKSERGRK